MIAQEHPSGKGVICPTCGGDGEVHSHNPICWECHGKGWITSQRYIEIQKNEAESQLSSSLSEELREKIGWFTNQEKMKVLELVNEIYAPYKERFDKLPPLDDWW